MVLFLYLIVFIFGTVIGSFLNCVIYRLHAAKSFLQGRSQCPCCGHILAWPDLVPVLSFLILKGKCRYCHKPISWQYLLVEISTGLLFLLIFNFQLPAISSTLSPFITTLYLFIISSFLIIIFVYDLKHYIIPDKVIYPAIMLALIFNFKFLIFNQFLIFNNLIFSAIGASLFFLSIVLISKGRWMGIGDIKLAFLMGLLLGFPGTLAALFLAFLIGAIIGIGLISLGRKTLKSEVPFGPFLVTGTFIALFFGERIINWYMSLIA